ncbi:hypothetical protein [Mesorhizobium sp. CAU 1741]|uniref:hypothetical protein n=1 Tax=Mesorhizobium sp. CAU 1741 TaxID=3140366 RepID=UPI00325ABC35
MLTVCTLLWDANDKSKSFSQIYDESWVEKLYRGFARNLTVQFRFVCYTDRARKMDSAITRMVVPGLGSGGYADCIKPYEMGVPMILVGLDTVVTGNCDHLAAYCTTADRFALPRDPYKPARACNGVALVPVGHEHIAAEHKGENDMDHVRSYPHRFIDDEFPGAVVSFKGSVKKRGLGDARIVYFHGEEKPHQLPAGHPILRHWI